MKLKEDSIDIYNNAAIILNKDKLFFEISWIITLIILVIIFLISSFVNFNIYKTYNGYIILDNNNSYVNLILENNDFPINKENKLYIKNDCYKYEIISIKNNNVILKVDLNEEIKINNNVININILKDRTSLFKIIKNKIKKGFGI